MEIEKNEEDSTIPSWINAELVTEILSEDLKKSISVVNFNVKRALPKGENYLSILYRVAAQYKEKQAANDIENYFFIVKALPEGEVMLSFLSSLKGFEKESYMYTYVLPAMYSIIKSAKGIIHPLSPRRLTCSKDDIIVMEDLKYLGYKMAMRKQGLDLDHCKIVVRALARFHAASIAVYKTDPSIKDIYVEGMYTDDEYMQKHTKNVMNTLPSVVETWQGFEKYGDKLRKISSTSVDKMIEIVKPKRNSLNVLNHGDCWVNNMLFRYSPDTGAVEDVRFVDFQIARYSSPALDLQYFMCNCPNDEVRFQHRDTLLEEYHSELSDYCKAMNLHSELISLQQLKEEFEDKDFFGLITACSILGGVFAEEDDVPDMKKITVDDVDDQSIIFVWNMASKKKYREIFQKLLVFYEKKGLL